MSALVQGFKRKINFRVDVEWEWGTSEGSGYLDQGWVSTPAAELELCQIMNEDIQYGYCYCYRYCYICMG